ncbi:restriction endonuclease subunit S [Sphaerisporangium sp. NPDC049002]|uniref:restriction endonuclease subunit S n=1 Tax=Sphaerisporangium sp. NPDC049002 TaxID=3155392 RepID=UPI0033F5EDDB
MVRTGEPGATAVIPDDLGPVNCSDLVIAKPRSNVDARFLCYAINETAREFIKAHTVGAVQQHFNVASAKELTLRVPSLLEQRAIAVLLGALDDKILINERIIDTADKLIRIMFTAALEAPGSRTIPLISAVSITFGAPFASSEFNAKCRGIPLLRIRDLKTFTPQTWTNQRLSRDFLVMPGETVAGMDAEFRPTFWLGEPALLNQRVLHAQSRLGGGSALAREALRPSLAEVESYKTGTTVAHLNKGDLEKLEVTIPSETQIQTFEAIAEPLRKQIVEASAQSRTLGVLRDTLLPQLMSGRLRIRDAEQIVEDSL